MTLLKVEGLAKHFGGLKAVSNVSFQVEKNEIVSIIGPNGAGKSTLLNLITRVLSPTSGNVYLNGMDIATKKKYELIGLGMARTFQNVKLFTSNELNVMDNIMLGLHHQSHHGFLSSSLSLKGSRTSEKNMKNRAWEIMSFLGIEKWAYIPVTELPFGNQRWVELGRALAASPQLLILDEPAAGLNDVETDALAELIQKINETGVSVLLVEHHMGLVMNISDKIVVINYGEKLVEGRPKEIQNNPKVIEAYLGQVKEDVSVG